LKLSELLPSTAQRCRSKTETFILEDLSSAVLSQLKKYHPSENLKFNYLGIFQSLKLRILMEKIVSIFRQLYFTPNTSRCYGLRSGFGQQTLNLLPERIFSTLKTALKIEKM